MSPLVRRFMAAATLLTLGTLSSGSLTGCCSSAQGVPARTVGSGSQTSGSSAYPQLPAGSNNPMDAVGTAALTALLFGISAVTGGHPLAPQDDSPGQNDPPGTLAHASDR